VKKALFTLKVKDDNMSDRGTQPQYPFTGVQARIFFFLIVLATIVVALDECYNSILWSRPYQTFTIEVFILILSGGIIAFSLAKTFSDFLGKYIFVFVLFGPIVSFIAFMPSALLFLVSFTIMAIWAMTTSRPKKIDSGWNSFLGALYVLWVLSGVLFIAIDMEYLPFGAKVLYVDKLNNFEQLIGFSLNGSVNRLLNYRYFVSLFFGFSLAGSAFWEACHVSLPEIQRLPLFAPETLVKKDNSLFNAIVFPFVFVASIVLRFLHRVSDAIWRMFATICFYLYQFTSKFVTRLYSYITSKEIWRGLLKVLISYVIIVLLTYGTVLTSKVIAEYLLSGYDLSEVLVKLYPSLLKITGFFLSGVFSLSFFRPFWNGFHEWRISLDRIAMAGAIIFLALILAGFLLHLIKYTNIVPLNGFDHFGPFLVLMVGMMAIFSLYAIFNRIHEKRCAQDDSGGGPPNLDNGIGPKSS